MTDATACLARSITLAASKQTYFTARLLVDRDLVDDFFRAYAYFRWVDDIVDAPVRDGAPGRSDDDCIRFIRRQRALIDDLYRNERPDDLTPEEEMLADLVHHDRQTKSGLQSFIRNMFAVVEFDAYRRGRLISSQELERYSDWLAKSATDGLQYFVGHGHPFSTASSRTAAAFAAHIAHQLRDMVQDVAEGFVNIPLETLEGQGISPEDVASAPFRAWVRERVQQSRHYFREGKRYIDSMEVLRCKIAASWYCARFEGVLAAIERDGYALRDRYNERRKRTTWLRMVWLATVISIEHTARLICRAPRRSPGQLEFEGQDHTVIGETS